jgi:hypothetical protein
MVTFYIHSNVTYKHRHLCFLLHKLMVSLPSFLLPNCPGSCFCECVMNIDYLFVLFFILGWESLLPFSVNSDIDGF